MLKRGTSDIENNDDSIDQSVAKRSKIDSDNLNNGSNITALSTIVHSRNTSLILRENATRISSLPSPELNLTGHEGAVYSLSFDPTGKYLCSGSLDRNIFLWDIFEECKNYNVLSGHKNAVLEVKWCNQDANQILSCSADKTIALWDANRGQRLKKYAEHNGIVNSCSMARDKNVLFASASDDCTAIVWDKRNKSSIATFYQEYPILSVCMAHDGYSLFTGGIDNIVRRYDLRMVGKGDDNYADEPDLLLSGHHDTITGLALSPDGQHLLSNGMDSSLRVWDIRPFATQGNNNRQEAVLGGVHHGAEKLLLRCAWSANQEYISCGSADKLVHLWETSHYRELCAWPGHKASINEVIFHPTENILASCSSDRSIIIGEFDQ